MLNRKKLLSLFVAALMLLSTLITGIAPAFAEETGETAEPVVTEPGAEEPIEPEPSVDEPAEEPEEASQDVEAIDPELDTDGDGLKDIDEIELYGTDPENADTDGDGLSDYDELKVYYTAPGDPDSDGDGLSDFDEINTYGTDPLKGDTDIDGLSDGDELKQGTDPKNPDTDGDGILDGDELILGSDPLKPEDISTVFQSSDGMVDGVTIEGYAPFVLFREGVVMPYGVESFLANPALIGKPVEIRLPEGGNLTLTFTVESKANEIAIFRMNDAGTVRLDAEQNGKAFTMPLTENGVYYAADLHKLNTLLGFEGTGVQNLPANTVLLEDFRYVTLSEPLTEGSSADTDGDGIPDCEEITDKYAIDLGNGYTATVYGYVSDPTLADSDFDGMKDGADALPRSNVFSGTYKSGNFTIPLSYTMNYQNFFGDNKTYSSEIASFSVWAAQLCYDNDVTYTPNETIYDSNGSTITSVQRIDTLMRAHGMENVIDYQLENGYFSNEISLGAYADDDITEVFFGHHKETVGDDTIEVITVFVRGTNGTEKEWCSNFDVGDLHRYADEFDCVTGKSPRQLNGSWNRKSNHRGFDVCATRIYQALAVYMDRFVDPEATPVFWLTGHSRGAAISNIVSSTLVDGGDKVFAYTYASPNTTANTEASAEKYDCIFNLVNGDDFVPMLPMPAWGFTRYGRTATYYAHNATNSQRSSLLGSTSYSYSSDLGTLVNKFAVMSTDGWRDVYVYHCYGTSGIDHVEVHQHAGETIGSYIAGSRMDFGTDSNWNGYNEHTKKYSYCVKDKDGGFLGLGNKWSCCQTPAYAMQILAITMGNLGLSAGWDFLTSYKLADRFDFGKTSLLTNYATKIIDPHYMENYYLIQKALVSDPDSSFSTDNSLYTNASHRPVHEHTYEIVDVITPATCTEPGVAHVICRCSQVNSAWYDDEIKEAKIPALGHDWGTPAWTWDGVTAATATFICGNDNTHVETRSTTEIVRTEEGDKAVYTATVEFEGETYTDVKTVEIGYYLIGSMTNWEVDETYRFTENAAAEGEYMLNANLAVGDEVKVVRAEGTAKLAWYPDYGGNYVVDYAHSGSVSVYFRPAGNWWNDFFTGGYFYISRLHTAEVVTDGSGTAAIDPAAPDFTATVTLSAAPNEGYHYDYTEIYKRTGAGENDLELIELGSLNWNDTDRTFVMPDYDIVIKVYFAAHTFGEWTAATPATCTEVGEETRTCPHCGEIETREIPALGHDWGTPTYVWAEDNSTVTAAAVCANDASHVLTETVAAVRTEENDVATYTATFENELFETQTKEAKLGWYLVGTVNEWTVNEAYQFEANPDNAAEYMLAITLAEGAEFKAVRAEGDTIIGWYPDGMDNNYVVGADQAGDVMVYFRPDGQGGDGWHYGYLYIAVPVVEEPAFKTQSLVLDGQIGVHFFVFLPANSGYEYQGVNFTIDNTDGPDAFVPYSADMPTNANGYYRFTYYVRSIEMADTITATLRYTVNGEERTLEKTYSVKQYFETFDDYMSLFTEKEQVMTKATADYGHYVQAFLETQRTWTIGTDYAEMDKFYTVYTADDISAAQSALQAYAAVKSLGSNMQKITYTLVLDSDTELRIYFKPAADYTGTYTFTMDGEAIAEDGEKVSVKLQPDGRYLVSIKNIAAHELSVSHRIAAVGDGVESYIELSALSYVNAMMTAYASNATAVNAAAAILRYAEAAYSLKYGD